MNFISPAAKTNWKFILIVVILAAITCGGILWWGRTQELPQPSEIKIPEKVKDETTELVPNGFSPSQQEPPEPPADTTIRNLFITENDNGKSLE